MKKVADAIIRTNAKLTKKPIRTSFSIMVPAIAVTISKIPKEDFSLSHSFPLSILKEERRIKVQLYNKRIPAAVVMYSNIFPGNKRAATTDAKSPIPPRIKEGRGSSLNFFNFFGKFSERLHLSLKLPIDLLHRITKLSWWRILQ